MNKRIAIVGVTGAVGQEMLKVLEKRQFPISSIKLLASKRSVGKTLPFKGEQIVVEELKEDSFQGTDIALFSAGGKISRQFAPYARDAGSMIIDNSSAFRMEESVPLVIPEVNPEDLKGHQGIIANPNCGAIILLMGIYPIHCLAPIKRIIVSTYQSASGAGAQAMEELIIQSKAALNNQPVVKEVFPHQIAFNLFSHNTHIYDNGYNDEENKIISEVRKILHEPDLKISATCVRVPILRAHSESINLELEKKVTIDAIRKEIVQFDGVKLVDDRVNNYFPMPLEASEQDDVFVGRLRYDLSNETGIDLFVAGDQLLKGAALNAVQIAEKLL